MIIFYGIRPYGKTRACGSSYVVTRFFHIWFLPLIPVGSQLVLEPLADGYRGMDTSLSGKSVFAGYARVWGPIAVLVSILIGLDGISDFSGDTASMLLVGVFTGVVTLALLAATIVAYAVVGSLSTEEKQQRSAYAMHTGYFVDPAEMGMARQHLRESLLATIVDRARGLASMGYRGPGDPAQSWPHYALDPTHNDDQLVTAAFALARVDGSLAQGPYKSNMDMLHMQLWQRIQRMNPPYLNAYATSRS